MEFEQIMKTLKSFQAWFQDANSSTKIVEGEILKPLDKLIDFEHDECIFQPINSF